MPTPFMCHECDSTTMNKSGICDKCTEELTEPTTADEYNRRIEIEITYEGEEEKAEVKKPPTSTMIDCIGYRGEE